ncbi:MAG: ribosome biogenesis GTPase Der [Alphaproteobacteria bacterium]|jgi:GTP-binding protein|nr:ribosome biogenesis GTPase Der [Alphaproteobacteria bacterium]
MFKIAIIGRPNVGKSTLFNFLSGKNIALTSDFSGLSRDRKENPASLYDMRFLLSDTGGYDDAEDIINQKIWEQASIAIEKADVVLFILDGKAGLSPVDNYLADVLRKSNKPIILCVNKMDTREGKQNLSLFEELGFSNICAISAAHNMGIADLYNALHPFYDEYTAKNPHVEPSEKPELMLALVGKPNAGKSTIINNLLGENRVITSDIAGTTRDSIYLDLFYEGKKIKLVDTAGLRRRSNVEGFVEKMANKDSLQAINFATVVALVISAEEGLSKQDLTLAKHVVEEGRGLIIVVNKIDLIKNKKAFLNGIAQSIEDNFFQIKHPYVLGISALKDSDINEIIEASLELYEKWQFKINTSALNRWLGKTLEKNQPPMVKSRRLKIKYASQIKSRPPTVNIWANLDKEFPDSYLRYLQNEFYKSFDLWGTTLRMNIQKSENPYKDKPRLNKREVKVIENHKERFRKG